MRMIRVVFLFLGGILMMLAGVIPSIASPARQDMKMDMGQTYVVLAGGAGPNQVDVLGFSPSALQIHRGDTVIWHLIGFHNIDFNNQIAQLIIAPTVDGKPLPQLNPEVAFPNLPAGGKYTGGRVNSGLPLGPDAPTEFMLTFDAPPGTYAYLCDVHPGMVGTVTVVPDDQPVPSPQESFTKAMNELGNDVNAGMGAAMSAMQMASSGIVASGDASVMAGAYASPSSVQAFFPAVVVIKPGSTVTWTIDPKGVESHTMTSLPLPPPGSEFALQPPAKAGDPPLILLAGPGFPSAISGSEVKTGTAFNSGVIGPDATYALKFTTPGVYQYGCILHPGMFGVVIVQAA